MSSDRYYATIRGVEYVIEINSENKVTINGTPRSIDYQSLKQGSSCSLLVDGKLYEPMVYEENGGWEIIIKGNRYTVQIEDERERLLRLASGGASHQQGRYILTSPMPGLVIDIPVKEGDQVSAGDVLVILESMKMQNELTAPRDGIVTQIQASVNDNVERKENLMTLE
jgi:acetyl/propionyl-CoA carboxylase alpha subunit